MRKRVGSIAAAGLLVLAGCGTSDPVAAFEKDLQDIAGVTLQEFLEGEDQDEVFHTICTLLEPGRSSSEGFFINLMRAEYQLTAENAAELQDSMKKNICDNKVWGDAAFEQPTATTQQQAAPAPAISSPAISAPSSPATGEEPEDASQEEQPAAEAGTLTYEVTSDAGSALNVTYATFDDGSYGQEIATDAKLPFVKKIEVSGDGAFSPQMFTLMAQGSMDASTITCKISLDGEVLAEQTSTGPASVVTCVGR